MVQTATKLKVALYVRKSREEEGAEETLHNQRETLVRIAEQNTAKLIYQTKDK